MKYPQPKFSRVLNLLLIISLLFPLFGSFNPIAAEGVPLSPNRYSPISSKVRLGLENDQGNHIVTSSFLQNYAPEWLPFSTTSGNYPSTIHIETLNLSDAGSQEVWKKIRDWWDGVLNHDETVGNNHALSFSLVSVQTPRPIPSLVSPDNYGINVMSNEEISTSKGNPPIQLPQVDKPVNNRVLTGNFQNTILAPQIIEEPSANPPEIFYSNMVSYDYQGGSVILTALAASGELCTDDKVIIRFYHPDGSQAAPYIHDYSQAGTGITCTPPIDLTSRFAPGINTVAIELWDEIKPLRGSNGYQLGSAGGDITPPSIDVIQLYGTKIPGTNQMSVSLLVKMVDFGGSGLQSYSATISDGTVIQTLQPYMSTYHGPDVYSAVFNNVPENKTVTITITASDGAGNTADMEAQGYFSNGQFFGYFSCMNHSPYGYTLACGNPVSTATGHKIETIPLLFVPGPGEADIDIALTYNSSSIRPGLFGAAMSSDLETEAVLLFNPLTDIEIVMSDGGRFRFVDNGDGTFTSDSPAFEGILEQSGHSYLLTTPDQIQYRFDESGQLVQQLDRNGNAIEYAYDGDLLVRINNGRTVTLSYNGDEYVETLSIGDKVLSFMYDGDKLIRIQNPNGGTWKLEYESHELGEIIDERGEAFAYEAANHYLTHVTTPADRIKNEQTYDAQGRVDYQISSSFGEINFIYVDGVDGAYETRLVDAYGATETHYYNTLGQLWKRVDRLGNEEFYFYDDDFHVVGKIDFNGHEWEYVRDERGNITEIFGPEGLHEIWSYSSLNDPIYHRDGDGYEWYWRYDDRGNLIEVTQPAPDGTSMTIVYNGQGLPTDIYDFNDNHIQNTYDPITGDLLTSLDAEGGGTQFIYDQYGRLERVIPPKGNVETYTYDLNDNLTAVDKAYDYHEAFEYDADDLLLREIDADLNAISYLYDERGRLVETRNGEHDPTFFRYGEMNELLEVENARGAITRYTYDDNYRVIQIDMPEDVTLYRQYDGLDNVLFETDGEGRVKATTYDGLSRPYVVVQNYIEDGPINEETNVITRFEHDYRGNITKIRNPLGGEREFGFDSVGRLAWFENEEDERTVYEHDGNSNLTLTRFPEENEVRVQYNGRNQPHFIWDGENYRTEMTYDLNGNLENVVDPDGVILHHIYNQLDQRTSTTANYMAFGGSSNDENVTTYFEYSLHGDLLKVIDAEAYEFLFEYDGAHRLIKETHPEGDVEYLYDGVGNLVEYIDANNGSWVYLYDFLDRLTTARNPENHQFSYAYDRVNNQVSVTDARGNTTYTTFDALNRPIFTIDPLFYETQHTYDAVGNLLSMTDGNGHTTTYAYDEAQRLLTRTDAEAYRIEYEYDDNGRLILRRIPFNNPDQTVVEHFAYDGRDLQTSVTNGEGEVVQYLYNSVGLLTAKIENDGVRTGYGHDHLRRLNEVTLNVDSSMPAIDDWNVSYQYGYDRVGNLMQVADPLNHTTTFGYNGLGSLVYERNPIGSEWFYSYDPEQNLTSRQDANGQITTYSYYPDNQLHVIDYPNDPDVVYTYDPNNNPIQMVDGLGATSWVYDELNRPTNVTDSLGRPVAYTYDALNRRSVTYPDGRVVQYSYLDNEWMEIVTDPVGEMSTYTYDAAGRITHTEHPNQTYSTRTYDRAHRLLTLGNYQDGGDVLSAFSYTYDAAGQRTLAANTYGWRNPSTVIETYTYDGLRRLVGVTDSEGMIATYGYDRASNRTLWETNDDPFGQSPQDGFTATYTYNEANELLSAAIDRTPPSQSEVITYQYDANGNRIDQLVAGNGADEGMAFTYDDENRLISGYSYRVTGSGHINWLDETTMAYDGNGRRLVETYDTHRGGGGQKQMEYTFDGLDPIAEYDLWNNHQRNYYRGPGNRLIQLHNFPVGTQGQQYWYHHNGLMSVAGMTKQNGQSTHNYRYDAYGGAIPAKGNFTQPHNEYTLTGKALDGHTNLYYFGARYYDAMMGVWLTQDTYRGELSEPMSLHRLGYVESDPTNLIDLYGYSGTVINKTDQPIEVILEDDNEKRILYKDDKEERADAILVGNGITINGHSDGAYKVGQLDIAVIVVEDSNGNLSLSVDYTDQNDKIEELLGKSLTLIYISERGPGWVSEIYADRQGWRETGDNIENHKAPNVIYIEWPLHYWHKKIIARLVELCATKD